MTIQVLNWYLSENQLVADADSGVYKISPTESGVYIQFVPWPETIQITSQFLADAMQACEQHNAKLSKVGESNGHDEVKII